MLWIPTVYSGEVNRRLIPKEKKSFKNKALKSTYHSGLKEKNDIWEVDFYFLIKYIYKNKTLYNFKWSMLPWVIVFYFCKAHID